MRPSNLHPIFLHLGHCGWSHVSSCDTRLPEIPGIPAVQAQVSSALGYCQPHHRILQRGVRGGLFYSLDPTSPSVLLQQSGNPPCVWGLSVPSSTEFIFLISMTRVPSGDCGHPARGREKRRDGYCMPVLSKIPEIEKIFVFLPWQEDQNVNSCPVLGNHCQGWERQREDRSQWTESKDQKNYSAAASATVRNELFCPLLSYRTVKSWSIATSVMQCQWGKPP